MTKKIPVSRAKTAYGLLSEVIKLILEEPLRYNQGVWLLQQGGDPLDAEYDAPQGFPACGTVGCVAGWVTTLKLKRVTNRTVFADRAAKILGLDEHQENELFSDVLADMNLLRQTPEYAKAGAAHIRKFQQRYSSQLRATKV